MNVLLPWTEIVERLALTLLAGVSIGLNRSGRGRAAGLRTTVLVSLAAAIAMIQANQLLGSAGRAPDSFAAMDVMRLPLGILSGMGFIGGGVILRRGQMVVGVTTAATLWFSTVMGLCFGGGQIGLGLASLGLALAVLWGFRLVEHQLRQERSGTLILVFDGAASPEQEVQPYLAGLGFRVVSLSLQRNASEQCRLRCSVRWKALPREHEVPAFVDQFAEREDVTSVEWTEASISES